MYWYWVLAIAGMVLGSVLIFMALFLRPNEEGVVDNILLQIWNGVDEAEKRTIAFHSRVLSLSIIFVDDALVRLYGYRLISWRAAYVGAFLSLASASGLLLLAVLAGFLFSPASRTFDLFVGAPLAMLFGLYWGYQCLVLLRQTTDNYDTVSLDEKWLSLYLAGGVLGIMLVLVFFDDFKDGKRPWEYLSGVTFVLAIPFAITLNIIAVASIRASLRLATLSARFISALGLCLSSLIIPAVLIATVVAPWLVYRAFSGNSAGRILYYYINSIADAVVVMNIATLIPFVMLITISFLLLINIALWRFLETPLRRLAEVSTEKRRKVYFTIGVLLLTPILRPLEPLLEIIKEWFLP